MNWTSIQNYNFVEIQIMFMVLFFILGKRLFLVNTKN